MAKNLEELSVSVSPHRQKIISLLSAKKWFRSTDFEIQKKLFTLPIDFDGYLTDLADRKDEYGGLMVNKLQEALVGNYGVLSIFEVMSIQNAHTFTYEYTSWKFGKDRGYRGLILFEEEGKIKYFLLRKTDKFAISETIYETVGTFVSHGNTKMDVPSEVKYQINKELGMKDVEIKRFIDLGKIAIDPVLANSTPTLYAAVIDLPGDNDLEDIRKKIYKTKPISFNVVVEPIEKIWEYVEKTDESYFLACVARLASMGIIET
ncbi:MAG TPA: hypothetical protein VFI61_00490 [Patescibacteria group bacterium]|nr:hypothetical protein [Patescibacteria group bacterium]